MGINSVNNTGNHTQPLRNISRNQLGDSSIASIFADFDKDGDGKLNSCNKYGFDEISAINEAYEKLTKQNDNSKDISDNPIANLYNKLVNFIKGDNKNKVFVDGKEVKANGKIDEKVEQGNVGDCWLLAGINALNDTEFGRDAIEKAIRQNDDGTYTVTFKGCNESYTISAQELQDAIDSEKYSSGDPDAILIEIAAEKHYDKDSEYNTGNRSIAGGEIQVSEYDFNKSVSKRDMMFLLTGTKSHGYSEENNIKMALLAKAENDSNVAMVFGTRYNIETGELNSEGHMLSISNVEKDKDGNITSVTIIDPWNNQEEKQLNYEEFIKYCTYGVSICTNNKNLETKFNQADENIIDKYINDSVEKLKGGNWEILCEDSLEVKQNIIKNSGGVCEVVKYVQAKNPTPEEVKNKMIAQQEKFEKLGIDDYINDYIVENGFDSIYNTPESRENLKQEFIKYFELPLEQRVEKELYDNKNIVYKALGFSEEEIEQINKNPQSLKEICEKYNFAY